MIATLDDVIERLADEIGHYGAHTEEHPDGQCECRVCFTAGLREEILAAVEVERRLGMIPAEAPKAEEPTNVDSATVQSTSTLTIEVKPDGSFESPYVIQGKPTEATNG